MCLGIHGQICFYQLNLRFWFFFFEILFYMLQNLIICVIYCFHLTLFAFVNILLESESEVTQSCPTLCDSMDCSPPGSSIHGIFQARVLEWVAISFSRGSSRRSNPGLLHCRQRPYHLSHQGSLLLFMALQLNKSASFHDILGSFLE